MKPTIEEVLSRAGYPATTREVVVQAAKLVGWGQYGSIIGDLPEQVVLGETPHVVSVTDLKDPFNLRYGGHGVYVDAARGLGGGVYALVPANHDWASWLIDEEAR